MINFRRGTFETNSSSTHTLNIITEDEYKGWEAGKYLFHLWEDKILPVPELIEPELEECKEQFEARNGIRWEDASEEDRTMACAEYVHELDGALVTLPQWKERYRDRGMDMTFVHYTSKHGDKITAFGYGGGDY